MQREYYCSKYILRAKIRNDSKSSNTMLQTIAKRIDNLERNLNGRIDTLSNRMDNMNSNINILNSRMVGLENRVDNLEERIDASINEHFDKVMTGIGKITGMFKNHEE